MREDHYMKHQCCHESACAILALISGCWFINNWYHLWDGCASGKGVRIFNFTTNSCTLLMMSSLICLYPILAIFTNHDSIWSSSSVDRYGVGPFLIATGTLPLILSCSVDLGTPNIAAALLTGIPVCTATIAASSSTSLYSTPALVLGI